MKINKEENTEAKDTQPEETVEKPVEKKTSQKKVRPTIEKNQLISVESRVRGQLIYKSRSGDVYVWDNHGDEQDMEYAELRNMMASQRSFFTRGWVKVMDEDVVEAMNLAQFEKQALSSEDIEYLFKGPIEAVVDIIQSGTTNIRRTILNFAREKYVNGELNDHRLITTLSEALKEDIVPNK